MRRTDPRGSSRTLLILFDVDGTLLTTNGAARRAFEAALIEVFGTAGPIDDHPFAGKTDPQIACELMLKAGLGRAAIEDELGALWQCYVERLDEELAAATPDVFPGVRRFLRFVEERHKIATSGLLTGNIEGGARRKLDAAGIGFDRFQVGAFGSDHGIRNELPALAARRAESLTGESFTGHDVVIVGDTPADVDCGVHFGARTVCVATGVYSREELAACAPDYLFDTLEEAEDVWEAIVASS